MNKVYVLITAIAALALTGCSTQKTEENMYANADYWYQNGRAIDPTLADVFYILPTCVHDWTDEEGNVCHYASLTDPEQREKMLPSYLLADEIFADSANFFAPYYRHISLETWGEGEDVINERFPNAMADIREAFKYYLDNCNNGRPFVLAGFSQGAKCVVELVKEMDAETLQQMVAAYVCGYRVTAADTLASQNLRAAQSATDRRVVIAYNTVTDASGINSVLEGGNVFVINPASWTTDTETHALNDSVNITIDPVHNVLVADGMDADKYFVPALEYLFPKGNLHLQELLMYKDVLRENVKERLK